LIPASGDAPADEATRASSVTWSSAGKLVVVTVGAAATVGDATATLKDVEGALARPGRFRLGYDLSDLTTFDVNLIGLLQRIHTRYQRSLERVAFCSSRALVRSGALVVAGATRALESKFFAKREPMQAWLEETAA
jgi:hypothetical protein